MSDENKIEQAAAMIKALTDNVPLYQDALQPAAKQIGRSLETVGRLINAALMPLRGLVWGIEQIEETFIPLLTEKATKRKVEDFVPADPTVAGPAIESLRFSGHKPELRDMYADLLITSIDKATARKAHPAFVEIIKQLSPDEAKIVRLLRFRTQIPLIEIRAQSRDGSGYRVMKTGLASRPFLETVGHRDLFPSYLDNLDRLRIIKVSYTEELNDPQQYERLEEIHGADLYREVIGSDNHDVLVVKGVATITNFGVQFRDACTAPD